MKKILVLGAGGFIGSHLVTRLKNDGHWIRGCDLKNPDFNETDADEFILGDLRDIDTVKVVIDDSIDEIYQLAADMGGAEYIFTGDNDIDIMHNSSIINLHVCNVVQNMKNIKKIFYSSSACMYPEYNQLDPNNPKCSEESAYPANPDSEYGWEKLFSERLYLTLMRNKNIQVRIARFHNIFGPQGTYEGGREKAPAALCRKVIHAKDKIEVFGDGKQTRSFLFIDECIEGIIRLMDSKFSGPVNIGSEEMITINDFAKMIIDISGKDIAIKNTLNAPVGVRGRNSDNKLIYEKLGWKPTLSLKKGISKTYDWIKSRYNL